MQNITTIQYSPSEFKSLIDNAVKEALHELIPLILKSNNSPPTLDKSISRRQAAEILHLSLPTIAKLQRQGVIKASIIGGSYRYSEKQIRSLLNKSGPV